MKKLVLFIFVLFLPAINALSFNAWVEGPSSLTVGRKEMINIYVKNNATFLDNYTVTFSRSATIDGQQNPSLIQVELKSNRILLVKPNETRTTFAIFWVLSRIEQGEISFNVTSDSGEKVEDLELVFSSESVQYPISLPEFSLVFLLNLINSILSPLIRLSFSLSF